MRVSSKRDQPSTSDYGVRRQSGSGDGALRNTNPVTSSPATMRYLRVDPPGTPFLPPGRVLPVRKHPYANTSVAP
jgi:hypothetical protein